MSAQPRFAQQDQPLVLQIAAGEHFDYSAIQRFRHLCPGKQSVDVHVIVDMQQTRYVDSSGVALLHCLHHWIKAPMVIVRVINCCPEMRKILSRSRLSQNILFD